MNRAATAVAEEGRLKGEAVAGERLGRLERRNWRAARHGGGLGDAQRTLLQDLVQIESGDIVQTSRLSNSF